MDRQTQMLARQIVDRARDAGYSIVTAESCTGGMVGAAITAVPGSSDVFYGGIIAYANHVKMSLLGVSAYNLAHYGAVSEEVARQMAEGAGLRSIATIAVSVTGIAGPGGSENKPEGRVCFGLHFHGRPPITVTEEFGPRGRDAVRQAATVKALNMIISALN